jgi:hypothetical protein
LNEGMGSDFVDSILCKRHQEGYFEIGNFIKAMNRTGTVYV